MKLPVAEQRGILYLPRVDAPLRLSALARREVKAGEFFFMRRKRRGIDLKTAFGGLKRHFGFLFPMTRKIS